jgi:hypothetical protein
MNVEEINIVEEQLEFLFKMNCPIVVSIGVWHI